MNRDEALRAFDRIRVWQKGGRRAVHKPLLVLLALGRLLRGESAEIDFREFESGFVPLLDEFGPSGAKSGRHYPFWHLRTDGLWELQAPDALLARPAGVTPTIRELREQRVCGAFPADLRLALSADPGLVAEIAGRIVAAHFPESLWRDVLDAVGIPRAIPTTADEDVPARRRDPGFRERVLSAYEYRCCVCGHDLRLGGRVVGLDAAHIKWFQAGGPDVEPNGLALCSLHHKIFDVGVFTILPERYEIAFSRMANSSPEVQARLLTYHGAAIRFPQSRGQLPDREFLEWHVAEVFKQPARG